MDRSEMIKIRMKPSELILLRNRAAASGLTMSEFVRKASLAPVLPAPVDQIVAVLIDLRRHLGRSGSILNQAIARGDCASDQLDDYRNQIRRLGRVLRRLE